MKFECPQFWTDGEWMNERHRLQSAFNQEHVPLSFRRCEWLGLQPLTDLLLHIGCHIRNSGSITLEFDSVSERQARVLRFLIDSGFIKVLAQLAPATPANLSGSKYISLPAVLEAAKSLHLPPRALDFDTLLDCRFLDAADLRSRDDVYTLCNRMREQAIARDRARALRMSVPLIYQTRLFFNAVLPELIDNIRLHKDLTKAEQRYYTLFARVRRRTDTPRLRALPSEVAQHPGPLQEATLSYWQHDMVEAALSDGGPGIYDTWFARWHGQHSQSRVPRLPGGPRLDGPEPATPVTAVSGENDVCCCVRMSPILPTSCHLEIAEFRLVSSGLPASRH